MRYSELRCKEVISVTGCARLGFVNDLEIDDCDGRILAIIVQNNGKCFGLFGKEEDIIIPWKDIKKIGEDIILVEHERNYPPRKKERGFWF